AIGLFRVDVRDQRRSTVERVHVHERAAPGHRAWHGALAVRGMGTDKAEGRQIFGLMGEEDIGDAVEHIATSAEELTTVCPMRTRTRAVTIFRAFMVCLLAWAPWPTVSGLLVSPRALWNCLRVSRRLTDLGRA